MDYEITPERKKYIEARGLTVLTACPGSGKTTSIAYKLGKLAELKSNRVICLSFTNNAVSELSDTFTALHGLRPSFPHKISTIDSFLSQFIVLPFWYLINGLKARPSILDNTHNTPIYDRHYEKNGKEYTCFYMRLSQQQKDYYYKHRENEFSIIAPNTYCCGNKLIDSEEGREVAQLIIKRRLQLGILTSSDVEYFAYDILSKHPDISKALSMRFDYMIMDEAQDMSKMQFEIINLLINAGLSNVELVGDLRQSIYAWRNAHPELFKSLLSDNRWKQLRFVDNRRSTQIIIDQYNKIKEPQDPNIKSHNVDSLGLPIYVYHYDDDKGLDVIQHFSCQCNGYKLHNLKVICRGNDQLKELTGNSNIVSCWKSEIPLLILKSFNEFSNGEFSDSIKTLKHVLSFINEESKRKDFASSFSYIDQNPLDVSCLIQFLRNLPTISLTIEEWQNKTERLIEQHFNFENGAIDFQIKKKMDGYVMRAVKLTRVCDFFNFRGSNSLSLISTVHKVKGLTYDACLVFLKKKQSTNLSLELFSQCDDLKETQRLLYVACSRPRQLLALAIPKSISKAKIDKYVNSGYLYIEI